MSHAPVHIKIEEKLSASVSRDGGLESGEVYHKFLFRKRKLTLSLVKNCYVSVSETQVLHFYFEIYIISAKFY